METVKQMTVGQIVDICIDYNNRHKSDNEQEEKVKVRKATQADYDHFCG